jgi:hypothetical protein
LTRPTPVIDGIEMIVRKRSLEATCDPAWQLRLDLPLLLAAFRLLITAVDRSRGATPTRRRRWSSRRLCP